MKNRLYMLSDSSLRSYSRLIADVISANILFYAQFGITSEIIEAFRSQIELAFSISEDKIVRIDKREFYGSSYTAYNAVAHKARLFGSLLKYHLGKDAPLVLEISAKGMSPRKHDESLARAGKIHQRLTAALPDLTGSGVTQELLDDFAAAIAAATAARTWGGAWA